MSDIQATTTQNTAPTPPAPKLNISSEKLDKTISDWKGGFSYNSTLIDFAQSFSAILTLFSAAYILIYIFASFFINLYPFYVFAIAAAIISCVFKIIHISLFAYTKSAATKSFIKYCSENDISLADLIKPTINLLAEKSKDLPPNAVKLNMKEIDRVSYRKFYFVFSAWKIAEKKENPAYDTYSYIFSSISSVVWPIMYVLLVKGGIFSTTTSSSIYLLVMIFVLLVATVPTNFIAKKRVVNASQALEESFPESKGIMGKYRVLINQLSMLLTL